MSSAPTRLGNVAPGQDTAVDVSGSLARLATPSMNGQFRFTLASDDPEVPSNPDVSKQKVGREHHRCDVRGRTLTLPKTDRIRHDHGARLVVTQGKGLNGSEGKAPPRRGRTPRHKVLVQWDPSVPAPWR